MDRNVAKRIYNKVSHLCENPYHLDVTKMVGDPYFRLRVGDYRVIFDIQNDLFQILVLKLHVTVNDITLNILEKIN